MIGKTMKPQSEFCQFFSRLDTFVCGMSFAEAHFLTTIVIGLPIVASQVFSQTWHLTARPSVYWI